jgi:hypothetical protein
MCFSWQKQKTFGALISICKLGEKNVDSGVNEKI